MGSIFLLIWPGAMGFRLQLEEGSSEARRSTVDRRVEFAIEPAAMEALAKLGATEERAQRSSGTPWRVPSTTAGGVEDLAKELRRELHPEVVVNTTTKTLHTTRFGTHAATTALACGWLWPGSSGCTTGASSVGREGCA